MDVIMGFILFAILVIALIAAVVFISYVRL